MNFHKKKSIKNISHLNLSALMFQLDCAKEEFTQENYEPSSIKIKIEDNTLELKCSRKATEEEHAAALTAHKNSLYSGLEMLVKKLPGIIQDKRLAITRYEEKLTEHSLPEQRERLYSMKARLIQYETNFESLTSKMPLLATADIQSLEEEINYQRNF